MPHYVSGLCANCDSPDVTIKSPLYCSEMCNQAASYVRYVRSRQRDGRDQSPEIQEVIQMRLASVLSGGYPGRARHVPDKLRAEVFASTDGLCENCGKVLDFDRTTGNPDLIPTIQHMRGNSGDLEDLRAWCQRCNMADAQSRFVPVELGSSQDAYARILDARISAVHPMLLCDDDEHWNDVWGQLASAAKEVLRQSLDEDEDWSQLTRTAKDFIQQLADEDEGADCTDLPGFEGFTEQGTPIQDI